LSIAASLLVAAGAYFYEYYINFKNALENRQGGLLMNCINKGLIAIAFFTLGFFLSMTGVAKYSALEAAENDVKENIVFGNRNSNVDVFIFTDWQCSGCRKLEPYFEQILPKIMKQARVIFVDDAVHPESLNFTPYNLSFMIYNKPQYFALRNALGDLSEETKTPSDQQVIALAAKQGVTYKQLNYSEVALGIKYYTHLVEKLKVEGTPTVVVVNRKTKKGKKLEGNGEITEANLMKAISSVKDSKK
jgi:protein-disulfide isomerase